MKLVLPTRPFRILDIDPDQCSPPAARHPGFNAGGLYERLTRDVRSTFGVLNR